MDRSQARARILALFTTLANGKPVTGEWHATQRASFGETRDVFAMLNNAYTQAMCGTSALTLRIDRRKDGQVITGRAEICSWSVDALADYAQSMSDAELEQLDAPCERLAAVARLAKLIDEGQGMVSYKPFTCHWSDAEGLGERYAMATTATTDDFSADELLSQP